jgi:hypothetical protein
MLSISASHAEKSIQAERPEPPESPKATPPVKLCRLPKTAKRELQIAIRNEIPSSMSEPGPFGVISALLWHVSLSTGYLHQLIRLAKSR